MAPLNPKMILIVVGGLIVAAFALGWIPPIDPDPNDGSGGFTTYLVTTDGEEIIVKPNQNYNIEFGPFGLVYEDQAIESLRLGLWVEPDYGGNVGDATITLDTYSNEWIRSPTTETPRLQWQSFGSFTAPLGERTQTNYGPRIFTYSFSDLDLPSGDYDVNIGMTIIGTYSGATVTERIAGTLYLDWSRDALSMTIGWNKTYSFQLK